MSQTHAFERSHDILIAAPASAVLDYVSNPNSWPEWLASSHEIDSPDRPMRTGDTFIEKWATRTGPAQLDWVVRECDPPRLWIGETHASFLGPIIVRYDVTEEDAGTVRFKRTMINPARPRPATAEQIDRMDTEAAEGLANIKRNVEARVAKMS